MPQNNIKISTSNFMPSRPVEKSKSNRFERKRILVPAKVELDLSENNFKLAVTNPGKNYCQYFRITYNKNKKNYNIFPPFERTSIIYRNRQVDF